MQLFFGPPNLLTIQNSGGLALLGHKLNQLYPHFLSQNDEYINEIGLLTEYTDYVKSRTVHIFEAYGFSTLQPTLISTIQKNNSFITIADLQDLILPHNFDEHIINIRKKSWNLIKNSELKIIALSDFTKKTIIDLLNIEENRISVIGCGVDAIVEYELDQEILNISKIIKNKKIILFPSKTWKHKSHKEMIEALLYFKKVFLENDIVIGLTGGVDTNDEISRIIEKYNLHNLIYRFGFISKNALNFLYKKSKCLIFPSLFEGFGIPVLEAVNQRLPVIAFRIPTNVEILGKNYPLVQLNDFSQLLDDALKVCLIDSEQNHYTQLLSDVKTPTWSDVVMKHIKLFKSFEK